MLFLAGAVGAIALAILVGGSGAMAGSDLDEWRGNGRPRSAVPRSFGVRCERPPKLKLVRFEDGSAQLRCGRRILVRVSVPG